jgi:HlyD family secretion protein
MPPKSPRSTFRRPSRAVVILVVVVLVAIAAVFVRQRMGTPVETAAVIREDLRQSVVSTGRVIATARIELGAQVAGTVAEVAVDEGDRVAAGDLLVRLADDEPRAALAQAEAALEEAQARLRQLAVTSLPIAEQARRQAASALVLARREHARVTALAAQGFFSEARLDEADRNLEQAEAQGRSTQLLADAARPRGSDHVLAMTREAQARRAVEVARAKLGWTRVLARADAIVLKRRAEPGDVVTAGTKLVSLGAGPLQIELQVDEKNVGLLAIDKPATVVADAYPDQPLQAKVVRIAPAVDAQRGTVQVKLAMDAPPTFLVPDMTVSAEIAVAAKSGVLTLPADAVREPNGADPWILTVRDGRAARQPVRLGLRGSGRLEIAQGAGVGDQAILPGAATVVADMRVRPVPKAPPAAPRATPKDPGVPSR